MDITIGDIRELYIRELTKYFEVNFENVVDAQTAIRHIINDDELDKNKKVTFANELCELSTKKLDKKFRDVMECQEKSFLPLIGEILSKGGEIELSSDEDRIRISKPCLTEEGYQKVISRIYSAAVGTFCEAILLDREDRVARNAMVVGSHGLAASKMRWGIANSIAVGYRTTAMSTGGACLSVSIGGKAKSVSVALGNHSGAIATAISNGSDSIAVAVGEHGVAISNGAESISRTDGEYSNSVSAGFSGESFASGKYCSAVSSGGLGRATSIGIESVAFSMNGHALSKGDSSMAIAYGGKHARVFARAYGKNTIAIVAHAGHGGRASAGEGGAFALPWMDGDTMNIAVGRVGFDGIKADQIYRVENGKLIEVKES